MPTKRKSEAIWNEKQERWIIKVQTDGERRSFYSSLPGRKGKHEAEGKADDWLESKSAKDVRFEAAWKLYLAYIKTTGGTGNYNNRDSIGRTWLLPKLKNKKVSSITANDFQLRINEAAQQGKSRRLCVNIRATIKNFCNYAEDCRMPIISPKRLTVPQNTPVGERKILQPDGLTTLFSKDYTLRYGHKVPSFFIYAFRFSVLRGLRRGELCGLKKEDIDGNTIHISRAVNNLGEETKGKNDNARRYITLSPMAKEVLEAQAAMLKRNGIISPWIFPDEHGERLDSNHFYKAWKSYRTAHNLDVSLHELRHTFVSIMKYDMPQEMLKDIVGHSPEMDTFGVYGHTVDGDRENAAAIMDDVFARLLGKS